jgi:tetratricopeptide (TPR) repeat protein
MKAKLLPLVLTALLLFGFSAFTRAASAEEPKPLIPDKALCAKMLQFGKQAYERGKYLDAKEYFRKAVQADPTSQVAWRYYDMAVIFALAEKTEQNASLLLPGTSSRQGVSSGGASEAPPPPAKETPKKQESSGFKIMEDEGC